MADINREAEEFTRIMAQVNYEMRAYGELSASTAARRNDAEMKAKFGLDDFSKSTGMGADALAKFGAAAFSSGKALLAAKNGTADFSGAMDQMTDAVKMAAVALTLLVPGGPLIKGLMAGIGLLTVSVLEAGKEYMKATNAMREQLSKGYQDLALSGAAASDGMTGLFNDAKKLGLSMNDIGQYTELIAANSKDLALFSGSVFEGRKRFADMGEAMEPFKESLMNAGLSQEQINAGSMAYLRIQTRTGAAQNKTTEELAAGAKKYLNEQDLLAKVTGQSRKEMEDQQARALQQQQFASKVRELTKAGQTEAVDRLMALNSMYSAMGPKMAAAFQASVTGNYANADAIEVGIASQNEMMRTTDMVIKNQMTVAEAAQKTGKTIGKFNDDVNIGLAGVNAGIGDFSEFEKARQMADGDIVANMKKADDERKKQGMDGGKAADALVQKQTELTLKIQEGNKAVEKFVLAGVGPATDAMKLLVHNTTLAAGAMAKMFGVGVGPQPPAGPPQTQPQKSNTAASKDMPVDVSKSVKPRPQDQLKAQVWDSKYASGWNPDGSAKNTAPAAAPAGGGAAPAAGGGAAPAAAGGGGAPAARSVKAGAAPASLPSGGPSQEPKRSWTDYIKFTGGTGTKEHFAKLLDPVQQNFAQMAEDYMTLTGKRLQVNSAYRSPEEQAKVDSGSNPKALPGHSKHQQGRAIDINSSQVEDLKRSGLLQEFGFSPLQGDPPHIFMKDGGIVKASEGGTPAIIGEGGRDEAVIPLKNGAVPVSLSLKDALSTPTFGGVNEYAGYNTGPMSTDLDAVKKLAEAVGAFDKTSQIITDTATWKQILSSGLATNYKLVNAELGTKALPGMDQDMADRLKEIKEQGNTTTEEALKQVAEELKQGLSSMAEQFAVTMTSRALSVDPSEIAPLLQELVFATKNGNDINTKILAASY